MEHKKVNERKESQETSKEFLKHEIDRRLDDLENEFSKELMNCSDDEIIRCKSELSDSLKRIDFLSRDVTINAGC